MRDILFLAYPLIDLTVQMGDPLPLLAGETKKVWKCKIEPGGSANIVFMATRLGLDIVQVGAVGKDSYGEFLLRTYREEGVDTDYIHTVPDFETQVAICLNDPTGQHAFVSMLDGRLAGIPFPDELRQVCKAVCISGYMLASGDGSDVILSLLDQVRRGGQTIFFDPGPLFGMFRSGILEHILAVTDVLLLNDIEAAGISGEQTPEDAAAVLSGRVRGMVVVKNGPNGCYVYEKGKGRWHRGFAVPLVDTTGAGDSFLSAFMRGYIDGWGIETTCIVANATGAAKVKKPGCGTQVPTVEEVLQVLNTNGYNVTKPQLLDRRIKLLLEKR